ncbi:hypothetical protein GCM10010171_37520 [Actinokineospora fastidiosa]|uniref:Uncharacterized protein n=1 Tax=Actinokineospora fastidiosa TaxID=1816 RepID=A0A918LF74_9PSEU|nr:hypothetical protein GCM10010171_37520 [Actinokineospora fastidiosa]
MVVALTLATYGHAQAVTAQGTEVMPYCSTLMGDSPDGESSRVVVEHCSKVSRADAVAGMRAKAHTLGYDTRQSQALIILYEHAYYGGASNVVHGDDGVCDKSGYRLDFNDYWTENLSSVQGIATCDRLYLLRGDDWRINKRFPLDAPLLGSFDNNINFRAQVYSSYHDG